MLIAPKVEQCQLKKDLAKVLKLVSAGKRNPLTIQSTGNELDDSDLEFKPGPYVYNTKKGKQGSSASRKGRLGRREVLGLEKNTRNRRRRRIVLIYASTSYYLSVQLSAGMANTAPIRYLNTLVRWF